VDDEGAHGALCDQLPELRRGGLIVHGRAGLLEEDLDLRIAREAHRQPAEWSLLDVLALLQTELVDVEVQRFVLVEDLDRRDGEPGGHQ
jgi:hypothetical protein